MPQHFHHWLVLVSLLVAILASYTALTLALRIRVPDRARAPAWLIGGGAAMGIGIWSMHFVGMLALRLPIEIAYDVSITALSMLIAIVVSTFALHIASRGQVGRAALVGAAIAMGIGICSMHYVGMAAIEISPPIRYDAGWVAISFAIAIAASFGALGIAFSSHGRSGWRRYHRAFGAIGMGLAIAGMHYAGMAAAQFPPSAVSGAALVNKGWLAGSVTTITSFVLVAALLMSLIESRAAARTARFRASLAHATETSRAKDEFLAMLAHELRNPLASITNAVHLLQRSGPDGTHRQFAEDVIARQSLHLTRIVDDLLDVGRAIAGKISLHRESMDAHGAVAETLRALAASGSTAGRHVELDGAVAWVNGDRTRIVQVVSNLVSNAVQHTTQGGRISVGIATRGDAVELTVGDDGAGMDAGTAARVFDLFFQGHQGPERKRGGLGIGLTLARRIVEMHDGTIEVASDGLGRGSTFTIRLPADPARGAGPAPAPEIARNEPRRVVIVEDADDARVSLQKVLEHHGHTVHVATDGPGGLEMIARVQPDIALVDIGLPGLDGYAVARQVHASGLGTYLVALTGYGLAEDRRLALAAGFDAHLTKPPPVERLLELVALARDARVRAARVADGVPDMT
jgi:NO-binding membrane sensor protein with MHYT domain/nitrogen-specific signal transduction histidine kinase/CheY-like chemotaxis protein